jgi:hypothetical protein
MRDFLGRVSGMKEPLLTAQPLDGATKSRSDTVTDMKRKPTNARGFEKRGLKREIPFINRRRKS